LKRKIVSRIMLTLLIIGMLTLAFKIELVSAIIPEYPAIYVDPAEIIDPTLVPGTSFTIAIKTDYTGNDITAYQFTLSYDPSILNGVEVVNGDLIDTGLFFFNPGTFDNTAGTLSLTGAFFFIAGDVAPGPGTLANVTFAVVGVGCSDIILGPETKLGGWDPQLIQEYYIVDAVIMPDHLGHGYFCNIPSIHLETDKDVYILGENVTITLENIGTETVSIGAYPAWGIHTYPEESLVYPSVYWFFSWSLEPGENDTFIWNQCNEFTNSSVYPGMYVVRDIQGWGLSAYFTILPGNLPPTADFIYSPTFPYVGQTVTFDASSSSDMDGTIDSYAWDFGDGLMGTDVITTHTYESAGTFTVNLTVTDDLGATDTLQQEITVDPTPTLTITINNIKKGTTETILLELVDDDYDGFITQDINNRILSIIKRTHKTTTFNFPGTYPATKGALEVTLQSRNDFTITLS
jgi:hypothetical protein